MRRLFAAALMVSMCGAGSLAETPLPLCVLDPAKMPQSWRPPAALRKTLNPAPWSERETEDAEYAKAKGVDEMIAHFERKPSAIDSMGADSIEALMQVTYASTNGPAFDAKVRKAARSNLTRLIDAYIERRPDAKQVTCGDFRRLLPLAIFAHELYPADDARTARVTERTNAAYGACGSLVAATGYDYRKILAVEQAPPMQLMEIYIWALWFMEAEPYPAIRLPAEARAYAPAIWKYFQTYRLAGASAFEDGPWDDKFIEIADLAPHIAHIPTHTHRFAIYVEDHPAVYRFHRENFYAVMQVYELDLFASIVDTLRQYGCTPENDIQVRDGTRYLLKLFHEGVDGWMDFRQQGEKDSDLTDYDLIHYAWTSVLGVRTRRLEAARGGTHGGLVRRWLPLPERKN